MPPTEQDIFLQALILLNGLTVEQAQHLQRSSIDLNEGWITLGTGAVPLVRQTRDALNAFVKTPNEWFSPDAVPQALENLGMTELQAQRKLAGALWITSEDTRLISNTSGLSDGAILPLMYTFPFSIVERLEPSNTHEIARASRDALQAAADWLERELLTPKPSLRQRITGALLEGKTIFLLANTGVNGLNLLYNLVMARLLSPAAYSQLALMVTLQLLIGLLPGAWQTTAARYGAAYAAHGDLEALGRLKAFGRRTLSLIGIGLLLAGLICSPLLANLFQLDSAAILLPLVLAVPFFIVTAADRGVLQGLNAFYWLTAAYVGEALTRFLIGAALALLLMGTSAALTGAAWGVGQSMLVTWFLAWMALRHLKTSPANPPTKGTTLHADQRAWLKLTGLTLSALIGQALITNSDFLLVKSIFSPAESGLYAAVSVLGRIAYFGALPLTIIMVPLFARRQALDQPTRPLFFVMLVGGAFFCTMLFAAAALFPAPILSIFYGDAYLDASSLLPIYTLAASLYVIVNLVITYRVALGKGSETILPLIAGVAQVIGILLFHQTLAQVIVVQIVLMSGLLIAVLWRGLKADP